MAETEGRVAETEGRVAEESAGAQRRRRAQGEKADELRRALEDLDPQLSAWTDDFVFGQVWGRDGLDQDERMLVAITALAALEHPDQLRITCMEHSKRVFPLEKSTRPLSCWSSMRGSPWRCEPSPYGET